MEGGIRRSPHTFLDAVVESGRGFAVPQRIGSGTVEGGLVCCNQGVPQIVLSVLVRLDFLPVKLVFPSATAGANWMEHGESPLHEEE